MISFITCKSDERTYAENVLESINKNIAPYYKDYEIVSINNANNKFSASEALNLGAQKSNGDILVFCHQDVFFLKNWANTLLSQIETLQDNWGVLGCAGATIAEGKRRWVSHVKDSKWRGSSKDLPRKVQTLDELILIIKKDSFKLFNFDEKMPGFHLYGADICLNALDNRLINYVVDAPVHHNSGGSNVIDDSFWNNLEYLKSKWGNKFKTIVTTCIDEKFGGLNMEYPACILCKSKKKSTIYSLKDKNDIGSSAYYVVECVRCGLKYTYPRPTLENIKRYYPKGYHKIFRPNEDSNKIEDKMKDLFNLREISQFKKSPRLFKPLYFPIFLLYKAKKLLFEPIKITPPKTKNAKALDIGCGSGKFLFRLKSMGWNIDGLDFNNEAKTKSSSLSNNVFHGTLESAKYPNNNFDFIILSHVLEHLHNPLNTLNEIKRILKNDGILSITVPNFNSLESQIIKNSWGELDVPRHLYHFTPSSLKSTLLKAGFKNIKIKNDYTPWSVRSILRHKHCNFKFNSPFRLTLLFPISLIIGFLGKGRVMTAYIKNN